MTSKHIKYNKEVELEPMPFKPDPPKPKTSMKVPPPPSPSKFIKGEFRESDYESDYEGRIQPVWRPTDSDSEPSYKPVRPVVFTPSGRRSGVSDSIRTPTPPTEFDRPPQFEGPPRPKFEPIEKPKTTVKLDEILQPKPQQPLFKPTPVNVRVKTQEIHHEPVNIRVKTQEIHHEPPHKQVRYYTGVAGAPIHTANYATETSNTVQMKESTENSHRVVNITQTRRVIPLGNQFQPKFEEKLEPFPYEPELASYRPKTRLPMPPTPTKFVRGEFRESDYESEVESAKIRPVWTPNPSDSDEPRYRSVSAPRPSRASSLPRTNNFGRIISPLEFDTQPPVIYTTKQQSSHDNLYQQNQTKQQMSHDNLYQQHHTKQQSSHDNLYQQHQTRTRTVDRYTTKKYQTVNVTRDDIDIKPGSPPKYGFIQSAENQIQNMNQTFKSKAEHFIQDLAELRQQPASSQKPILKKTHSVENNGESQAYREESRVSQYGKSKIFTIFYLNYFNLLYLVFNFSKQKMYLILISITISILHEM